MSLDASLQEALEPVNQRIALLQAQLDHLKRQLAARDLGLDKPVYDAAGLKALGYSVHESYRILHAYGHKKGGRLRVTADRLAEYQKS